MPFQRALKNEVAEFIRVLQASDSPVTSVRRSAENSPSRTRGQNLAGFIDHTLLKADATQAEVRRVCAEARARGFATVCLNSAWIELAAELLAGAVSRPIAVVGFPLGAALSSAKAYEAREAIARGAAEIDMVIALGALKAEDYETVLTDIRAVVEAGAPVKVILETCLLSDEQKLAACFLAHRAGAAFVKTSTGFSTGGATEADIRLMRRAVEALGAVDAKLDPSPAHSSETSGPMGSMGIMGVKASGGIRTTADALKMIAAGATRIGASSSVAIVVSADAGNVDAMPADPKSSESQGY